MSEHSQPTPSEPIKWEDKFAWVRIFRSFRIALDIRKMILGSLALLCLMAGDWVIDTLPSVGNQKDHLERSDLENYYKLYKEANDSLKQINLNSPELTSSSQISIDEYQSQLNEFSLQQENINKKLESKLRAELARLKGISKDDKTINDMEKRLNVIFPGNHHLSESNSESDSSLSLILKPLESFVEPLGVIILQPKNWVMTAKSWTKLLYSILVWSFFGLAISRMAAVQFARQENIGLRTSMIFSLQKFLSAVSAPIIPLCGIGLFWFLGTMGGWIGNIPGFGEIILGIFWFLPLLFGFAASLVLVGLCLGWPLMVSAISTEGSDGFDGFSRSYSYLFSRPWNFVWYVLVTLFYGVITISLFYVFINGCCYLSNRMISSGMEMNSSVQFTSFPEFVSQSWNGHSISHPYQGEVENNLGRTIANFWVDALSLLCSGLAVSFFWTGSTVIYFLIRRADDATDFNEVYHPKEDLEDDLLPLVGLADSEQPTMERPVDGVQNPDAPMEVKPREDEKPEE